MQAVVQERLDLETSRRRLEHLVRHRQLAFAPDFLAHERRELADPAVGDRLQRKRAAANQPPPAEVEELERRPTAAPPANDHSGRNARRRRSRRSRRTVSDPGNPASSPSPSALAGAPAPGRIAPSAPRSASGRPPPRPSARRPDSAAAPPSRIPRRGSASLDARRPRRRETAASPPAPLRATGRPKSTAPRNRSFVDRAKERKNRCRSRNGAESRPWTSFAWSRLAGLLACLRPGAGAVLLSRQNAGGRRALFLPIRRATRIPHKNPSAARQRLSHGVDLREGIMAAIGPAAQVLWRAGITPASARRRAEASRA